MLFFARALRVVLSFVRDFELCYFLSEILSCASLHPAPRAVLFFVRDVDMIIYKFFFTREDTLNVIKYRADEHFIFKYEMFWSTDALESSKINEIRIVAKTFLFEKAETICRVGLSSIQILHVWCN